MHTQITSAIVEGTPAPKSGSLLIRDTKLMALVYVLVRWEQGHFLLKANYGVLEQREGCHWDATQLLR